jgi:hypothetical protein
VILHGERTVMVVRFSAFKERALPGPAANYIWRMRWVFGVGIHVWTEMSAGLGSEGLTQRPTFQRLQSRCCSADHE